MKKILSLMILVATMLLTGCSTDAQVASHNLSQDADMFRIERRIVFYNGITNQYILTIEGKCSIKADRADKQLEVTCKTGENKFKKHFLGISDNVTYFVEQLESRSASVYHYKVLFKPQEILPDVDFAGSLDKKDLPN